MPYQSTKTYGHELGLSACFRQHGARSHCNLLHGYALSFKFVFEADVLDYRNWVVDFGGLKALKARLLEKFDHKLVVARDDPALDTFFILHELKLAEVTILKDVGCEAFAREGFDIACEVISEMQDGKPNGNGRVRVVSCECAEHGANSAVYVRKFKDVRGT